MTFRLTDISLSLGIGPIQDPRIAMFVNSLLYFSQLDIPQFIALSSHLARKDRVQGVKANGG
jgi:hypothetical protein